MHVWLSQRAIEDWASTGMVVNSARGQLNTKNEIVLFMLGRPMLKYRKDTYLSVFSVTFCDAPYRDIQWYIVT